jgi:hypothetical protein
VSERARRIAAEYWEGRLPDEEFEARLAQAERELVETTSKKRSSRSRGGSCAAIQRRPNASRTCAATAARVLEHGEAGLKSPRR